MKKASGIFVAAAAAAALLIMLSLPASSAKKKDQNCLNKCAANNKFCFRKARGSRYKDRVSAENDCIREKNTCINLCPEEFRVN